jgi:hypothetical protein
MTTFDFPLDTCPSCTAKTTPAESAIAKPTTVKQQNQFMNLSRRIEVSVTFGEGVGFSRSRVSDANDLNQLLGLVTTLFTQQIFRLTLYRAYIVLVERFCFSVCGTASPLDVLAHRR